MQAHTLPALLHGRDTCQALNGSDLVPCHRAGVRQQTGLGTAAAPGDGDVHSTRSGKRKPVPTRRGVVAEDRGWAAGEHGRKLEAERRRDGVAEEVDPTEEAMRAT